MAGCPEGGTVLDPFGGSGTTAAVARELGRKAVLIELNPDYIDLQKERLHQGVLHLGGNVDYTQQLRHLSLCAGYEGIGLGLRRVFPYMREVAHVEIEAFAAANLVAKMEAGELDPAPIYTDLKTFPYERFAGCVDILSGGFPCQPFSAAGKRRATEDPRHLFPAIARGIRECQPTLVFLENVEGILSCKTADGDPVLQYVLSELEEMGYRATAGIFSAEEVGAPHRRKRVFILGNATPRTRCGGKVE